jgi:hypothetical protein
MTAAHARRLIGRRGVEGKALERFFAPAIDEHNQGDCSPLRAEPNSRFLTTPARGLPPVADSHHQSTLANRKETDHARVGTWWRVWGMLKDELAPMITGAVFWKEDAWAACLKVLAERPRRRK